MHHGSCLCRGVTFRASRLDGPFVYCHCESCRKSNGSAFGANISVPIDGFEILTGSDLVSIYESSPGKRRHFCRVCGSPLYTTVGDRPAMVRIRLGSLDSDYSEKRAAHIFVGDKAGWYEIADDAPRYDEWPDPGALRIPGSRQEER